MDNENEKSGFSHKNTEKSASVPGTGLEPAHPCGH